MIIYDMLANNYRNNEVQFERKRTTWVFGYLVKVFVERETVFFYHGNWNSS